MRVEPPSSQHRTLLTSLLFFVAFANAASSERSDSQSQSSARPSGSPIGPSATTTRTDTRSVASTTFASSRTTKASEASSPGSMPTASASASTPPAPAKAPSVPSPASVPSTVTKMPTTESAATHSAPPATTKKSEVTSSPKPSPTSARPQTTSPAPRPSPSPSSSARPPPGTAPRVNDPTSTPPTSSHASSVETSRPASTITSVTIVNKPLQTTVTAHPNSTFAVPVSITALNSLGSSVLTAPPLVTIMSTSTLPDGNMTTVTQIVANPVDGLGRVNAVSDNGFFHNSGIVAGVFTVVGIVAAAVLATLVFCIRSRRRTQRRKRWLAGMKPQQTYRQDDPFQDPTDTYEQKGLTAGSIASVGDGTRSDGHSNAHLVPHRMSAHDYHNVMGEKGNFMLYPDPYPLFNPELMVRPRVPEHAHRNDIQMEDIDLNHDGHNAGAYLQPPRSPSMFRPSYAPSTPSIYPASLPGESEMAVAGHEADNSDVLNPFASTGYGHQQSLSQTQTTGKRNLPAPPTIVVPPRPPRSQLRESARNVNVEFAPLTPPDSATSSKPPSPISPVTESYPRDVLTRKTFLDVRPRA